VCAQYGTFNLREFHNFALQQMHTRKIKRRLRMRKRKKQSAKLKAHHLERSIAIAFSIAPRTGHVHVVFSTADKTWIGIFYSGQNTNWYSPQRTEHAGVEARATKKSGNAA
jgi:hypothetical protein